MAAPGRLMESASVMPQIPTNWFRALSLEAKTMRIGFCLLVNLLRDIQVGSDFLDRNNTVIQSLDSSEWRDSNINPKGHGFSVSRIESPLAGCH
jgi:hypothetical protein